MIKETYKVERWARFPIVDGIVPLRELYERLLRMRSIKSLRRKSKISHNSLISLSWSIVEGIDPTKEFLVKDLLIISDIPTNLIHSYKYNIWRRLPIVEGIVPLKRFAPRSLVKYLSGMKNIQVNVQVTNIRQNIQRRKVTTQGILGNISISNVCFR